jgi:xylulokinase
MDFLLGIDIGTTSARAIIIDESGKLIASSNKDYSFITPKPGWVEQDPDDWWEAAVFTIKEALARSGIPPQKIKAIGLTGQMHGSVFLDKNGEVIRPAILWNDQRTFRQCEKIYDVFGYKEFIRLSYNKALPGFTAPKILWLRDTEPDNYKKIYKILLPKDYIRYKLSRMFLTEVSDASGTILMDIQRRCWSDEILDGLDIHKDMLPEMHESNAITAEVSQEAAEITGLAQGTPIAGGGSDNTAGAVGSGIVHEGLISDSIGTSGVVFASSDQPLYDEEGRIHCWCHSVPGKWLLVAATLSAAGSLKWYYDKFGASEEMKEKYPDLSGYKLLDKQAENVPVGSEGLMFLPYLSGERYLSGVDSHYGDPHARGVFFGISYVHGKDHFVRSVMEGVAYSQLDCLQILKAQGIATEKIVLFGGGAKSGIWRQIIADICDTKIVTLNVDEGPAYGAALVAGAGVGIYSSLEDSVGKIIREVKEVEPVKENVKVYASLYQIYRSLYEGLKVSFKDLAGYLNK